MVPRSAPARWERQFYFPPDIPVALSQLAKTYKRTTKWLKRQLMALDRELVEKGHRPVLTRIRDGHWAIVSLMELRKHWPTAGEIPERARSAATRDDEVAKLRSDMRAVQDRCRRLEKENTSLIDAMLILRRGAERGGPPAFEREERASGLHPIAEREIDPAGSALADEIAAEFKAQNERVTERQRAG